MGVDGVIAPHRLVALFQDPEVLTCVFRLALVF
jgi:hypothetical protein